jgi:uncharacterized membrane protein
MMRNKLILIVVVLLGILDSGYLTVVHFLPSALKCPTIGTVVNCETVLSSSFATVFGVPLAAIGLFWFVITLILVLFIDNKIIRNLWMIVGIGGIVYSIVAQSIIGKICIYCVTLDVLIALSVGMLFYMNSRK